MLISLVASIGDDLLFEKAKALYIEVVEVAFRSNRGRMMHEIDDTMQKAMERAAENGHLELCNKLLSYAFCAMMLRGGARGSSVAICSKAMGLGARPCFSDLEASAGLGSLEVFKLMLESAIPDVSTRQWSSTDKWNVVYAASAGKDRLLKLDFLLSRGWVMGGWDGILRAVALRGDAALYNWVKLHEAENSELRLAHKWLIESNVCFNVRPKNLTPEYLEVLLKDGVGIDKSRCFDTGRLCEEMNFGPLSSENALGRIERRKKRRESIGVLTRYFHILHENGYRRYSIMLAVAIHSRVADLVDMVLRWGRDDLKEDDADYSKFTWIADLIPEQRKDYEKVYQILRTVLDSIESLMADESGELSVHY
jgi:hypothetical protein